MALFWLGLGILGILSGMAIMSRGQYTAKTFKINREVAEVLGGCTAFFSFFYLVLTLIIFGATYLSSIDTVASLRGFRDSQPTYVAAICKAEQVGIPASKDNAGSFLDQTYRDQAQKYTEILTDYRDKVAEYNDNLRSLDQYKHSPYFGSLMLGIGDLKPIEESGLETLDCSKLAQ